MNIVPSDPSDKNALLTPLTLRGLPIWVIYLFTALGLIYLLNPTAGVIELIPDNMPLIGNLDEGMATMMIWYGLLEFFEGRKTKSNLSETGTSE